LDAEGFPVDVVNAQRVWRIIKEVTDGNWRGAGRIMRFADILKFAGADAERRSGDWGRLISGFRHEHGMGAQAPIPLPFRREQRRMLASTAKTSNRLMSKSRGVHRRPDS
jgi:hypothetical protein